MLIRLISLVLPIVFFSFSPMRFDNYLISCSKFYFSDSFRSEAECCAGFYYYLGLSSDSGLSCWWELLELSFSRVVSLSDTLVSLDARSFWLAFRSFKQSIMILKFFTTISSFRLHSTFTVTVFSSWIYPSFCIYSNKIIV